MATATSTPETPDAGLAELRALQEFMAGALFRPLAVGDRMQRRWTDGRPMSRVVSEHIKPNEQLSSFERLEIYSRGYWFRILDCLYEDFPVLVAVLGQRRFHRLITAYLAEFPSASYTLRDLGERLPGFIAAHAKWVAPHEALAQEAARFEWARVVAFDGEAKPAFGVDAFLGADPETLRIGIQPYLSLLLLEHPLDEFALLLKGREEDSGQLSNTVVEATERAPTRRVRRPRPQRIHLAVHRYENSVYYKRLEPAAFAILSALQAGEPLAAACARGAEVAPPEEPLGPWIQRWFHDWAALGWICA